MISLPIDSYLGQIEDCLKKNKNLVVTAAPGAGKTTRLPPTLMKFVEKKILVLEPRRVAAASAAARIAEEQGFLIGREVGYQVRFENKSTDKTKLLFLTEALLSKKIQNDPELKDIEVVILDEFHERSIHTDLSIGLLKELQELSRPDLKIIVMSATMDAAKVSAYLGGCPILDVPGKIYDLEVHYRNDSQLLQLNVQFIERCVEQIKSAQKTAAGHILVFLPGVGEIERVKEKLGTWAENHCLLLFSLHGSLNLDEQRQVLMSSEQQKIILATNVAESALTIDGVNTVVDSGLMKALHLNSQTGLPSLKTQRISKASATQRAGRAARQGPGRVFRMWNKMDEISMPNFEIAEIHRTDLADTLLVLASQGISDFHHFSWYEPPHEDRLKLAIHQLRLWQAFDEKNLLTEIGKKMAKLPIAARIARLLVESEQLECTDFGCDIAAILSERDFLQREPLRSSEESDLLYRYDYFNTNRTQNRFRNILKTSEQLKKLVPPRNAQKEGHSAQLVRLLLAAYPDRIAKRRRKSERSCILIDGKGAELSEFSCVSNSEYFFAIELIEGLKTGNAIISIASSLDEDLLKNTFQKLISKKSEIHFDQEKGKLYRIEQDYLEKMPLGEPTFFPVTQKEAEEHLPEISLERFDEILRSNQDLRSWLERYDFYSRQTNSRSMDLHWKSHAITDACYGETSLERVKNKDLIYFFESKMDEVTKKDFHESCPEHVQVPSGSHIPIQYFQDKNPMIEVRLQEVFGWTETPKLLHGKIPITISLLAPNYRPVQVTQDLASFWNSGYIEVRKELRARYPKHSWPDNPLTAKAEAKGRPRR